jgi:hypothetical protein
MLMTPDPTFTLADDRRGSHRLRRQAASRSSALQDRRTIAPARTTRTIAERAGVNAALVHYHFDRYRRWSWRRPRTRCGASSGPRSTCSGRARP